MAFELNLIVAVGNQYTPDGHCIPAYPIGKNGNMPWHCKEDLAWFKEVTMGYPIIMGRKTFESLKKPLVGRLNIVISKTMSVDTDTCIYDNLIYADSVENAIKIAEKNSEKAFVIGGGSIYKYVLECNLIDNIYLDELDVNITDADTYFPNFKGNGFWKQNGRRIEIVKDFAYASVWECQRGAFKNDVDYKYLKLCKKIVKNGIKKVSRAGNTYSLFGEQLRFNLKKGLPMLTTKKMFSKGVIHELLWFLKGDTNIKYLVDNGVHIWDDDAYRYYLELTKLWKDPDSLDEVYDKETFLKMVKLGSFSEKIFNQDKSQYHYGDLGPVYGAQWTNWNGEVNQIQDVIHKLKTNPDDRRIMLSAWNPSAIPFMALPPCHYCCQFYTKEMTLQERIKWAEDKKLYLEAKNIIEGTMSECTHEYLDSYGVPTRKLSCMWMQRSVDTMLGLPFNILSYSLLTHMIAQCVNMDVDELIFNGGDVHIYENQISALNEQLSRSPYRYNLPYLELNTNIKNIEDFKYEDIKIMDYKSYPSIKIPLSVGL
jgi:thymidylate synthase